MSPSYQLNYAAKSTINKNVLTWLWLCPIALLLGVGVEKLRKGSSACTQALVRADLRHHPVHQHDDLVDVGQEADSVSHQDTSLRGRGGRVTLSLKPFFLFFFLNMAAND